MTQDGAKNFVGLNHPMLYATVGPGDALFLPAGWIFAEHVDSMDFIGARMQFMSSADSEHLTELSTYLVSAGSPNALLQKVVDALTIAAG